MTIDITAQDFIVHPRRGILQHAPGISRTTSFGKRSCLPPGMLPEDPVSVETAATEPEAESLDDGVLDMIVIAILSHFIGILAHWELLGHLFEFAMEAGDNYSKAEARKPKVNPTATVQAFGRPGKTAAPMLAGTDVRFGKR